ncbi:MAG: oxygen-independent coproporphyrinogen III oxidase, partial [Candidatus Neomarinimicrobiota bacterium]
FNRASCGLQDFAEQVQQTVNRIQPYELTEKVLGMLRKAGISHINLDLIYGLPHQTVDSFARTLEQVLTLNPSRLAVYNYAHVPWLKKHQKLFQEVWLPGPEVKLEMLAHIIHYLTSTGNMVFIGMDHFARPEDELATALSNGGLHRNFQGYSTRAGLDMYALGITSIGHTHNFYFQNHRKISSYRRDVERGRFPTERGIRLSAEDHLRRRIIQDIMCRFQVDIPAIEREFGLDFRHHFAGEMAALAPFADAGLLLSRDDELSIPEEGRLFIRNIAMVFDAYLRDSDDGALRPATVKPKYSQTV